MHIISWTNKTDSFGHIYPKAEDHRWYTQTWRGARFWDAIEKLRELKLLQASGNITNLKHIFEE